MKYILTILIIFITVAACKKNTFFITQRDSPEGKALVKVVHVSATNTLPSFRIKINDQDVSNTVTSPVGYPGGGLNINGSLNSDYLQVEPGSAKFLFYTPAPGTGIPLINIYETTQTFEANKKFSLFITDTAANTTAVVTTDDTVSPDSGFARIKFVNLIPNAPGLDLYQDNTVIIKNIGYKQTSGYVNIPFSSASTYSIRVADAPASSTAMGTRAIATSNRRIYTFLSRGYTGTTGTRAPTITAIINQ